MTETLATLPLFDFRPKPHTADAHAIGAYLLTCEPRGQTRKQIAAALGWEPTQATWRRWRAALSDYKPVLSAPGRPYVHETRATIAEIDAMADAWISQGRKMEEIGIRMKRRARQGAGK